MEWLIWITYLSGLFWVFGYFVYIPLGTFWLFTWMQYWDWVAFFEMIFDGKDALVYVLGPMRRFQVGVVIFTLGLFNMLIPGWNFIAMPLLGYWAVQDYYDYKYNFGILDMFMEG